MQINEEFQSNKCFKDYLESEAKHNQTITAIVSYKKGEHLKLIPFFKPLMKETKFDEDEMCEPEEINKRKSS